MEVGLDDRGTGSREPSEKSGERGHGPGLEQRPSLQRSRGMKTREDVVNTDLRIKLVQVRELVPGGFGCLDTNRRARSAKRRLFAKLLIYPAHRW